MAADYLETHGQLRYRDLAADLEREPDCPKLQSYWSFHRCGCSKADFVCSQPSHIGRCPLPGYPQRNGRLNQTGYALFLFTRDIAGGDLAGWIRQQIKHRGPRDADGLAADRAALLEPLRNVYGVADKVLSMALSGLLMAVGHKGGPLFRVGASMIVVDTLVHNFAPDRDSRPGSCPARLRHGLLSAPWLRRHYPRRRRRHRCEQLWGRVPEVVSAAHSACDLALLRRRGSQYLQRQSN